MEPIIPIRKRIIRFLIAWAVIAIGFLIFLFIDTYPEFPSNLNRLLIALFIGIPAFIVANLAAERYLVPLVRTGFNRLGERKLRTINLVLAGIIVVPLVIALLIGLVMTALGK